MLIETSEKRSHKTVSVDLTEPIFKKTARERKELREKILQERKEAFNILAEY